MRTVFATSLCMLFPEIAATEPPIIPTTQRVVPLLVYADISKAHDFLVAAFGFASGGLHHDADGQVVHGEVLIGGEGIWLHHVSPKYGLRAIAEHGSGTSMINVFVDDVDAHHARAAAAGAAIIYPPVDQPYGQREYGACDPEGHIWSFATRLPH